MLLRAARAALRDTLPEELALLVEWDAARSAERIAGVLRDGARSAALVEGIAAAAAPLTWDRAAASLLELYEDVVAARPREQAALAYTAMVADDRRGHFEGLYWQLHGEIGPTGHALVGAGGLLDEEAQRAIAALARREGHAPAVPGALPPLCTGLGGRSPRPAGLRLAAAGVQRAVQRSVVAIGLRKKLRAPAREFAHAQGARAAPVRRTAFDALPALERRLVRGRQGEFFGIVGRNGSGKSTLLKCMAGIYGVDSGEICVNGRLSTFIELGVGFNPDLAARDNVILNAIMLGLTPARGARALRADHRVRRAARSSRTSSSRTTRRACSCGWRSR